MFGHFTAEELLNLIEGVSLPEERRVHLTACETCAARFHSVESLHSDMSTMAMRDHEIPEPDWSEFRSSVRTELLSRSIQRESTVRRWTGWAIRPALAWGLSLGLVVCVMTGGFLWHISADRAEQAQETESIAAAVSDGQEATLDIASATDPAAIEKEKTVWDERRVFESVAELRDDQVEQLRRLLASAPVESETVEPQ